MAMWAIDNVVSTLKILHQKYDIQGSLDVEKFCMKLGMSVGEAVYLLACVFVGYYTENMENQDKVARLRAENKVLNNLLFERLKNNGRNVQMAKVSAGLPIAQKRRKSLVELELQIMFGLTDEELMDYFKISKTTLWRWKKEIAEKKKAGISLIE